MNAKERAKEIYCASRECDFPEDFAWELHIAAALESARAEALEEAAKVAEGFESIPSDRMNYGDHIAAAIRSKGKK